MDFIFDPSLVLYLPLGRLDGTSFVSRDCHGHLCTITGTLWGLHGRYFDGIDDRISANTTANGGVAGEPHTMAGWGRLADWDTDHSICGFGRTDQAGWFDTMYCDSNGNFIARTRFASGTQNIVTSLLTYTDDTDWHFLALVVDADSHINHFSVDGIYQGSDTTNANDLSSMDEFYIGQFPYGTPNRNPWKGDIGEVWVYGRELTPLEIQHNYEATKWRYR